MIDFSRNYFELFGLPSRFRLDSQALDRAYRALQTEVHPDRHTTASDAERRVALQSSARVNEAYRTLRNPVERATHLLSLRGAPSQDEGNAPLDVAFLERQLERREELSEAEQAGDLRKLEALHEALLGELREREAALGQMLDTAGAWEDARTAVREMRFLTKLADDIDVAIAALDA